VIRGWLDPIVSAKVHFTYTVEDLEKFIPRSRILKELEGDDDYEYQYVEPQPDENDAMTDTSMRDTILTRRQGLFGELQEAIRSWILASSKGDKNAVAALKERREQLIEQMNRTYWELDPYVRARSFYDRCGILRGDGKVLFYPQPSVHINGTPHSQDGNGLVEVNGKHE
jgi:hypothetical protein